jgi:Cu(I)/Ag(I) efflux system membrane fusion protein
LYSEDIAIAKQDYFAYTQLPCLVILKMPKHAVAKQKLLFYGLSNAQIESIKGMKQFHHTPLL